MTIEQAEDLFDSKPVSFAGWSTVILMILGNSARLLTTMDVNDTILFITSIIAGIYLVFKMIIGWFTMVEKIYEYKKRRKEKSNSKK